MITTVSRRRRQRRKQPKKANGRPAVERTRAQINPHRNKPVHVFTDEERQQAQARRKQINSLLFILKETNMLTNEELKQAFETGYINGVKLTAKAKQDFYNDWVERIRTGEDVKPLVREYVVDNDNVEPERVKTNAPVWMVNRGEAPELAIGERYFEGTTDDMIRWFGSAESERLTREQQAEKLKKELAKEGKTIWDVEIEDNNVGSTGPYNVLRSSEAFERECEERRRAYRLMYGISDE